MLQILKINPTVVHSSLPCAVLSDGPLAFGKLVDPVIFGDLVNPLTKRLSGSRFTGLWELGVRGVRLGVMGGLVR